MSFVTSSLDILQSKTRIVLSFFLILWLFAALCLGSHNLILKTRIKHQRMKDIESALSNYLKQSSSAASFHFDLHNNPPNTIDFIRLTKGEDQLLITGNNSIPLTGMVDLDPLAHGAWIDLAHPEKPGQWLLISQKLSDGSVVQAGRNDSSTGLAIYQQAVSTSYLIFLLATFPCLALAFLFRYWMRKPLRTLATDIKHALEQNKATFKDTLEDKDLSRLYQLLEQTFTQNRQLIVEMQSSLDNVAHDLRTPMTRLRAVAEYALQSDKDDPHLYRSALSDCLEESERVLSTLKIMMSVAEAESGTMRLNLQKTNLMETLDDVIGLYQYVAEEEQITVSCNRDDKEIFILADNIRISQVWANLLDNAIKYGHESGKVTISAEIKGEHAAIRFCDDGMGISETEINRIWDRLYRGDRSRTKQGLGLGLNYVKAVVEAHGGQVVVTSKIKEGSCFEVRLPMMSSALPWQAVRES
jgi:signal transduction histidine kinase